MEEDHIYDVCIVGGGLGGLATAVALLIAGFENIVICERDRQMHDRKQGYGLTLTNSLCGPLAKLQLLDVCVAQNCLSQSHYTFTSSGEIIGYYGRLMKKLNNTLEQENRSFGGSRGNLRIPRQDFRDMMLTKIKELLTVRQSSKSYDDIVQWGYKFITYEESEDYVTTTFDIIPTNTSSESIVRKQIKSRILLGADGIRSKVRVLRDERLKFTLPRATLPSIPSSSSSQQENNSVSNGLGLHYLGINVILGISAIDHPLLYQKGYYVVDGVHRLFTMPYYTPQGTQGDVQEVNGGEMKVEKPLVMWQLSYSGITESEAMQLRSTSTFQSLLSLALEKVSTWFPSSQALIEATLPGEIWSTPLYDREEMKIQSRDRPSRVTVLGDASHPMSMMKGQGANQALEDAILFVEWFSQCSEKNKKKVVTAKKRNFTEVTNTGNHTSEEDLTTSCTEQQPSTPPAAVASSSSVSSFCPLQSLAKYSPSTIYCKIRNFEREMIARSFPKVLASREAAKEYHSPDIVHHQFGINGIKDRQQIERIMELCKERHVNAYLEKENELDDQFEEIVREVAFTQL